MKSVAEATWRLCWTALRSFMTGYSEFKSGASSLQCIDEVFYCLCVYFDGCYGDFFLYLNDRDLVRTAIRIKESFPDLNGHKSVEQVEDELRWNCGDFRYSFFNVDPLWQTL